MFRVKGLGTCLLQVDTPHPVIGAIRDKKDHIRALLYSYHTTITGWGVVLTYVSTTVIGG